MSSFGNGVHKSIATECPCKYVVEADVYGIVQWPHNFRISPVAQSSPVSQRHRHDTQRPACGQLRHRMFTLRRATTK